MIAIDNLNAPHRETRDQAIDSDVVVEFYDVRQQLIEYAHTMMQFTD